MQEIELKFLVQKERLKGLMRQVNVKSSQNIHMAAHYFDTSKRELAQAGIGLRIRQEDDTWVQTIKAGGDGIAARLEHNTMLDKGHVQAMLAEDKLMPDLSIYKDTFIAPALADFALKKLTKNLTRQYTTDIQRTTRLLEDENGERISSVEMAYDDGEIISGNNDSKRQVIQEIEFELVSGELEFLFTTAKTWCKRYQLCLSTVTKAERGGLLLLGQHHSTAVMANWAQLAVDKNSSSADFIRAAVHHCLLQILPNASAIVGGSLDIDHIKQLNYGIQRLHAVLKSWQNFADNINPDWLPVLKQAYCSLTTYLQLVSMDATLEPKLAQHHAPAVTWQQSIHSATSPITTISTSDFQLTLLNLIAFTMNVTIDAATDKSLSDYALIKENANSLAIDRMTLILNQQQQKLLKNIKKLTTDTIAKDVKNLLKNSDKTAQQLANLHYLSKFAAPLYADKNNTRKRAKRWLKKINDAQYALDTYRHTLQYQHYYQQRATTDTNALFGAGWLAATLITDGRRYQKSILKLQTCEKFW